MAVERVQVTVGGRALSLSNLDKVLYPDGFTKAQVIDYYARIAPLALAHWRGRALTLRRFPDGADKPGFFEKRCPEHRPPWVRTAPGPGQRNGPIEYCCLDEPAAVVWAANLAALEIHAPMAWATDIDTPAAVVFDLDPGPPAAIGECCQVALAIRDLLTAAGLQGWCKTSGSKGVQLYVPLNSPATHEHAATFALAVGQVLERRHPERVTTTMAKAQRTGKVFVDWSQNSRSKTTIAAYSLRARAQPTVSTPLGWDEVEAAAHGEADLRFLAADVLERADAHGDLFAPVLGVVQSLPQGPG